MSSDPRRLVDFGDASFIPDLEAWEPWRPHEVGTALGSMHVPWAVAGGWAIDLHLEAETRPHEDIEIVVSHDHMEVVAACLDELDWFGVGNGARGPWPMRRRSYTRHGAATVPVNVGGSTYSASPGMEKTGCSGAIGGSDDHSRSDRVQPGRDSLSRPEIVLLFKAKAPKEKDEADLALTLPTLTVERIEWLRNALEIVSPKHDWTARLGSVR